MPASSYVLTSPSPCDNRWQCGNSTRTTPTSAEHNGGVVDCLPEVAPGSATSLTSSSVNAAHTASLLTVVGAPAVCTSPPPAHHTCCGSYRLRLLPGRPLAAVAGSDHRRAARLFLLEAVGLGWVLQHGQDLFILRQFRRHLAVLVLHLAPCHNSTEAVYSTRSLAFPSCN